MLLLASQNARFSLNIINYQFANAELDGWDSEWLQVSGDVVCPLGSWKFLDPCLTTFELKGLAEWLTELKASRAESHIDFTEPNLRFAHLKRPDGDILELHVSHEASPPWLEPDERLDGYSLHFPFSSINFNDAAKSVKTLYELFPE